MVLFESISAPWKEAHDTPAYIGLLVVATEISVVVALWYGFLRKSVPRVKAMCACFSSLRTTMAQNRDIDWGKSLLTGGTGVNRPKPNLVSPQREKTRFLVLQSQPRALPKTYPESPIPTHKGIKSRCTAIASLPLEQPLFESGKRKDQFVIHRIFNL